MTGLDTASADGALAAARELSPRCRRRRPSPAVPTARCWSPTTARPLPGRWTRPGATRWAAATAFLAGLVVARAGGAGWADAARLALGAAAANAAVPGAGRFQRADAERLAGPAAVSPI